MTKNGKKAYRGQRRHWYVYFYDDDGKFRKKRINMVEVPYYGSLIRRRKTYICSSCGTRYRSMDSACPKCGNRGVKSLETQKPSQLN
jgi:rubrerythrin